MSDVARVIILKLSDMTIGFLGCVSYNKMSDVTRINSIKLCKIINLSEGALVNYISKALRRECYRSNWNILVNECEINDNIFVILNAYIDVEYKVFLDDLVFFKIINQKQKYVLLNKYYDNFTDNEIAKDLSISRQAISKIHQDIIVRVTYKFDIVDAVKKDVEYIKQYVIKKPK